MKEYLLRFGPLEAKAVLDALRIGDCGVAQRLGALMDAIDAHGGKSEQAEAARNRLLAEAFDWKELTAIDEDASRFDPPTGHGRDTAEFLSTVSQFPRVTEQEMMDDVDDVDDQGASPAYEDAVARGMKLPPLNEEE